MRDDPHEGLLNYLRCHHVMTLATQGPEGPWAAAVFYVNDGPDVYSLSAPSTRHARNLAADPRVAATVQDDYSDWRQVRGIQLEGDVTRLDVPASAQAATRFARKFPFTDARLADQVIAMALNKIAWYRLRASVLYFIDNSRGFGSRERFESGHLWKNLQK
ncbi:pyridoxamine 5'-phosphate oxidase family protein [Aromatoleum evansii]|uniref:pyridoxamine 5'-phosphate oxidase family protein n=1 Tax=Aromatoleum evansii TaxID=59406 RepID=UPI00145F05FE|nr:pyridoxamine 5'-phosphate oxidase family protein [Aromatoleum evansii]NMG28319.1 pyridoxamine 5'-phosphate oxidase [Aromatoleum evansii]